MCHQGLQWSFGHDSLEGLGLGLSVSLDHHDAAMPHQQHGAVVHSTPIRTGTTSMPTTSWGPLPNDVDELSMSLSFTGMSLDESARSARSARGRPNLEVIGHSAQIRPMDITDVGSMEPPPPGAAFLSPSELPLSPRAGGPDVRPGGGGGSGGRGSRGRHGGGVGGVGGKEQEHKDGSATGAGGAGPGISPTATQLSQLGQSYRAGEITAREKAAMKTRILGRHQIPVLGTPHAGASPDMLSPTAQRLQKVNMYFKGGHITKQEKDELKMHIMEASTDSL